MGGTVSFGFALFVALGCGLAMFFIGWWKGYGDGKAERRAPAAGDPED
jgi:hypothetical protein